MKEENTGTIDFDLKDARERLIEEFFRTLGPLAKRIEELNMVERVLRGTMPKASTNGKGSHHRVKGEPTPGSGTKARKETTARYNVAISEIVGVAGRPMNDLEIMAALSGRAMGTNMKHLTGLLRGMARKGILQARIVTPTEKSAGGRSTYEIHDRGKAVTPPAPAAPLVIAPKRKPGAQPARGNDGKTQEEIVRATMRKLGDFASKKEITAALIGPLPGDSKSTIGARVGWVVDKMVGVTKRGFGPGATYKLK